MKRGTLLLTVIAGLAVFLIVLALYLPASWFAAFLPPQARCTGLAGSIWHGECLGLTVQNNKLGDATWNFAAGAALGGKLSGDVDVRGGALSAQADVDTSFGGVGELRNVVARFPLDPAFIADLPPDKRGTVSIDLKRVVIGTALAPRQLEGTLDLADLRQVGARPLELGSYRLTFDGVAQPDGTVVGKLRDTGGPFALDGTLTLTPPNAYLVSGFITGRTAQAESMVREISLGARPDASGRTTFSFEGSF
ncbi:MAG: type II secretion system protein N [Pseudomonadota bacterium]